MPDAIDRLSRAVQEAVRAMFPRLDYQAFYRYVVAQYYEESQSADLQPFNHPDLPFLEKVPLRTPGMKFKLKPETTVIVGFENADPGLPFVAFLDQAFGGEVPDESHVDATTRVKIGPNPELPAFRQGDMVASGGNGTIAVLYPSSGAGGPVVTGVPYLISFGTLTGALPGPPPLQGKLYGFGSSGSPFVRE